MAYYSVFKYFKKERIINSWYLKISASTESFFLVWIFTLLLFLLLSSESWYVFHIVVPFTLLLSSIIETQNKFVKQFFIFSILYNLVVIFWVPFSLYFVYKSPEKTEEFFHLIEKEIE